MKDNDFMERRCSERRRFNLEPPAENGDAFCRLDETGRKTGAPLPCGTEHRQGKDRRVGERRQKNIGPPPGTEERRFRPDLRGVVFPLYY